ncbi:MAG TPA: hypothetical protein VLT87_11130 [Thermoanaerobaculia bacterium]|nr:hypothetical protein [Thermoanaerobaculia bacterium]
MASPKCQTTHCSGTPAGWGNYPKHCVECGAKLSTRAMVRFAAMLEGREAIAQADRELSAGGGR